MTDLLFVKPAVAQQPPLILDFNPASGGVDLIFKQLAVTQPVVLDFAFNPNNVAPAQPTNAQFIVNTDDAIVTFAAHQSTQSQGVLNLTTDAVDSAFNANITNSVGIIDLQLDDASPAFSANYSFDTPPALSTTDLIFQQTAGLGQPPVVLDFDPQPTIEPVGENDLIFIDQALSGVPPIVLDFAPETPAQSLTAALALTTDNATAFFNADYDALPTAELAFTTDAVNVHFQAQLIPFYAQLALTTDDAIASFDTDYNANVHRLTLANTCVLSDSTNSLITKYQASQQQTQPLQLNTCTQQDDAQPIIIKSVAQYKNTAPRFSDIAILSEQTTPLYATMHANIDATLMLYSVTHLKTDQATSVFLGTCAGFDLLTFALSELCAIDAFMGDNRIEYIQSYYPEPAAPYTPATDFIVIGSPSYTDQTTQIFRYKPDNNDLSFSDLMPTGQPITLDFQGQGIPQYDHTTRVYDEPLNPYTPTTLFTGQESSIIINAINNTQAGVIRTGLCFTSQRGTTVYKNKCSSVEDARPPPPGTSIWIDPPRPPVEIPPEQTQFIIEEKDAYLMQHIITATLLDNTPINLSDTNISLDADSFAYTFSANLLDATQLPLLKQTGTEPVQIIITIDGIAFNMLVEKISRGREFAKNTIRLTGRSLSALLGTPYQQPTSATQGSVLTIQQIADLQLPLGWTINWNMPTWLVPAGAYTHSNATPIQAIKQIAENIGAVVVPHKTLKQLTIQPRYPVLPWNFASATPDVIIPDAAIPQLTERPALPEQANGVYIHGNEVGGVIGFCRLNSTAGDKLAQTQSNALMTDATALRALGERTLAGNATQTEIEEITLPMDNAAIPLLEIGQLIEINYDSSPIRAIVNSVSLSASLSKVRQTIQLGETTANTWTQFKNLLPADPMLLATLSSTDGTTSIMTMLDGGVVRVRGTGTVNNQYYIRSGRIDGAAPNMTQSVIVI